MFDVLILSASTGSYAAESIHCAPSAQMLTSKFCEIPMSVLTATNGPFALPLGRLIQAKVAASNSVGRGQYSALNTVGVLAQTAPKKPISPPQRNAAST